MINLTQGHSWTPLRFMFSDRRSRDSRQIWNVGSISGGDNTMKKRYCFRKVSLSNAYVMVCLNYR
jgi:hypothetical protein